MLQRPVVWSPAVTEEEANLLEMQDLLLLRASRRYALEARLQQQLLNGKLYASGKTGLHASGPKGYFEQLDLWFSGCCVSLANVSVNVWVFTKQEKG